MQSEPRTVVKPVLKKLLPRLLVFHASAIEIYMMLDPGSLTLIEKLLLALSILVSSLIQITPKGFQ